MDWSGEDVTNMLDLKQLEELFGQDSESKPKTPGKVKVSSNNAQHVIVYMCISSCKESRIEDLTGSDKSKKYRNISA